MSVLPVTFSLHNVQDVESLVRKVAEDRLRYWGAKLKHADHEELISYLISTCWELSEKYDPALDKQADVTGPQGGFSSYASRILTLRCADWFRGRFGDTRHGERPVTLSLDAPLSLAHGSDKDLHETSGDGSGGSLADRLEQALASSAGDPAVDRSPDLVGVLAGGSGDDLQTLEALGEQTDGRAQSGARAANPRQMKKQKKPARVLPRTATPARGPSDLPPPYCPTCVRTFTAAFKRSEKFRIAAGHDPRSDDEILKLARERAQAVKFGTKAKDREWVCPRCTTVTQPNGDILFLQHVHPNRESRRAAIRAARKPGSAKQHRVDSRKRIR